MKEFRSLKAAGIILTAALSVLLVNYSTQASAAPTVTNRPNTTQAAGRITATPKPTATPTPVVPGSSFLNPEDIDVGEYTVTPANGNSKYFRFIPKRTGNYQFVSSLYTNGNPRISLYGANQALISSDDNSGENNNFWLTSRLNADQTYYIMASGIYTEGYKLTVEFREWSLSQTSVSIGPGESDYYLGVFDTKITSVVSSNPKVCTAYTDISDDYYSQVKLTKTGIGNAVITVTGEDGTTKTCNVKCSYSPLTLSTKNVKFGKKYPYDVYYVYDNSKESHIVSIKNKNKKVATVKKQVWDSSADDVHSGISITAKKPGKTKITVKDNLGRTAVIKVTVDKKWPKYNLNTYTYATLSYGSNELRVSSKPGTKVSVKIKNKTYTAKIGKKGNKIIKVKSLYKLRTKMQITAKLGKNTIKKKSKVSSGTYGYRGRIWSCQYTIPVSLTNITKGDRVILTAGGVDYKRTINYSAKNTTIVFTTRYQNRNYSSTRIRIKNKYNQTLYDTTSRIYWN